MLCYADLGPAFGEEGDFEAKRHTLLLMMYIRYFNEWRK